MPWTVPEKAPRALSTEPRQQGVDDWEHRRTVGSMAPLRPHYQQVCANGRSLRAWHPGNDAPKMSALVESSLPELQRWLPWARKEPLVASERLHQLQEWSLAGLLQESFTWGIWDQSGTEDELVGAAGLHPWSETEWSIGYWVGTPHTGRGHALWAAGAVGVVALEKQNLSVVHFHVAEGNGASMKVVTRLGATPGKDISVPPETPGESGIVHTYTLTPQDLPRLRSITGELSCEPRIQH